MAYNSSITNSEVLSTLDDAMPVKPNLEDFWNLEAIGIMESKEDKPNDLAYENFRQTLAFNDDRYHVTWP